MLVSLMCHTVYDGPTPHAAWPAGPAACDRDVAQTSFRKAIANAKLGEDVGFDWVSVSEHHFSPITLTPNPIVMAAALSQTLSRVKIAVLGPLLPLNNPVRVAEELAMLDCINGGRTIALFLRGTPNEHKVYNPVAERSKAMTQEGIDLILKAWREPEPFSWHGGEYDFETVSVWPRGPQSSGIPVFGSGNSEDSIVFAAERRLSIALSFLPIDKVKEAVERYRAEADKAGWTPTKANVLYRNQGHVAQSYAAAEDEFESAVNARALSVAEFATAEARELGGPASGVAPAAKPFFFGGPKEIEEKAAALSDCGVGVLDFSLRIPGAERQASAIEWLGRECIPAMAKM